MAKNKESNIVKMIDSTLVEKHAEAFKNPPKLVQETTNTDSPQTSEIPGKNGSDSDSSG